MKYRIIQRHEFYVLQWLSDRYGGGWRSKVYNNFKDAMAEIDRIKAEVRQRDTSNDKIIFEIEV